MTDNERADKMMDTAVAILIYTIKRSKERKMTVHDGLCALSIAYTISVAVSSGGNVETARKKHEKVWEMITTAPLDI